MELNDAGGKTRSEKEHSAADCQMVPGRRQQRRTDGESADTLQVVQQLEHAEIFTGSLGYWNMVSVFSKIQMVFQYT